MIASSNTMRVVGPLVLACVACGLGSACGDSQVPSDNDVNATFEALAAQLQSCRLDAQQCLKDANCDTTKGQACRDDAKACLDNNRAIFEAFGQALVACVEQTRTCVADAADTSAQNAGTGSSARKACKQELQQCVADAKPGAPALDPCLAGIRTCVQDSSQTRKECFDAARSCFMNELPPRCMK